MLRFSRLVATVVAVLSLTVAMVALGAPAPHNTLTVCVETNGAADATDEELDFAADPSHLSAGDLAYYWQNTGAAIQGLEQGRMYYVLAGTQGGATARSLEMQLGQGEIDITGGGGAGNLLCKAGALCMKDYHVQSHKCKPCASYYENAAGDDVHHQNTVCTRKLCPVNQYVNNHQCLACPPYSSSSQQPRPWVGGPNTHCHSFGRRRRLVAQVKEAAAGLS